MRCDTLYIVLLGCERTLSATLNMHETTHTHSIKRFCSFRPRVNSMRKSMRQWYLQGSWHLFGLTRVFFYNIKCSRPTILIAILGNERKLSLIWSKLALELTTFCAKLLLTYKNTKINPHNLLRCAISLVDADAKCTL